MVDPAYTTLTGRNPEPPSVIQIEPLNEPGRHSVGSSELREAAIPVPFDAAVVKTNPKIAGGIIAVGYALRRKSLGRSLDLAAHLAGRLWGRSASDKPALDRPGALAIPYAPAIAIGTLFAYLAQ